MRHLPLVLLSLTVAACADAPALTADEQALTTDQCDYFAVDGRTRICHATDSSTHPYTILNVSENACVQSHADHAGDYIAVDDPTCQGGGCLPGAAPCDATVPCCEGFVCLDGACQVDPSGTGVRPGPPD